MFFQNNYRRHAAAIPWWPIQYRAGFLCIFSFLWYEEVDFYLSMINVLKIHQVENRATKYRVCQFRRPVWKQLRQQYFSSCRSDMLHWKK
jgi:hypothetical protein